MHWRIPVEIRVRRLAAAVTAVAAAMVLTVSGASSASLGAVEPEPRLMVGMLSEHQFPLVPFVPVTAHDTGGDTLTADERAELTERVEALAERDRADVGIAVQDLRTGATYNHRSHEQFFAASVAKLSILTMLLARAEEEGRDLTPGERSQAEVMIRYSDNDVANALYQRLGFTDGFIAGAETLGFTDTEPNLLGRWGSSRTTAADQMRLLRALYTEDSPLSEEDRAYVRGLMESVAPEQAWGVSAAAGPDDTVGVKNGWTPREASGGLWNINSVGYVAGPDREYLVVVLTDGNGGYPAGVALVEELVSLVTDTMEGTPHEDLAR